MIHLLRRIFLIVDVMYADLKTVNEDEAKQLGEKGFKLIEVNADNTSVLKALKNEVGDKKFLLLIKRALEREDDIYAICDMENQCIGYCCCSIRNTWESGLRRDIEVPKGYMYFFDDFVSYEKRGNGAHKYSVQERLKMARKKGFDFAQVAIYHWNTYSMKSYERYGFRLKQRLLAIRPLKIVICLERTK